MVAANCLTAIDVQCQRSLSIEQCDITAIICSEPEEQVDSRPININQCFAYVDNYLPYLPHFPF